MEVKSCCVDGNRTDVPGTYRLSYPRVVSG